MDDLQNRRLWLALHYLITFNHPQLLEVLAELGSPQALFQADEPVLERLMPAQRDEIRGWQKAGDRHPASISAEQDLALMENNGIRLLTLHDQSYPMALRELSRPPLMLFAKGNVEALRTTQLAVVGARKASKLAQETAFSWSAGLAQHGLAITSGLALGIDGAAHRGALSVKGTTIAVLAHGLAELYPPQHRDLADEIVERGVLVSEFPPRVEPRKEYFPRRNRIISGLSAGVLVVEAALKSGSLITARYALEQNRDVFAVPGSVNNPMVKGCHQLIKDGAYLVESPEDILSAMDWQQVRQQSLFGVPPAAGVEPGGSKLLEHIAFDLVHIDELVSATGLPVADLGGELLLLEAEGYIEAIGGNFRRIR